MGSAVVTIALNSSRRRKETRRFSRLWGKLKSKIYDTAIVPLTSHWYAEVLGQIEHGSRILDIGVGTGSALVANGHILQERNIAVVGVDYDAGYVATCQELIARHRLSQYVSATCCSLYVYYPEKQERFDHVYFSGSFMILPDGPGALRHAVSLLKDTTTGRLYFTQTFQLKRNYLLEWVKPILAYLTSIDFGKVTYAEDFEKVLQEAGIAIISSKRLDDGNASRGRESRLVVAQSRG